MHRTPLESCTKARTSRWLLRVEGQTMVVDLIHRNSPGEPVTKTTQDRKTEPAISATVWYISFLAPDPDAIEAFYGPQGLGLPIKRTSAMRCS